MNSARIAWHGLRKHPPAAVGDRFGPRTVIGLLPRGAGGTSNERVHRSTSSELDVLRGELASIERRAAALRSAIAVLEEAG